MDRKAMGRADDGEGLSLAIAEAATNEALGAIVLLQPSEERPTSAIG